MKIIDNNIKPEFVQFIKITIKESGNSKYVLYVIANMK